MKECPAGCVGINQNGNFCYNCGSKLIIKHSQRCSCGEHFHALDKFCTNCGLKRAVVVLEPSQEKKVGK